MKGATHGSKLLIGFVVFWLLGQGSVLAARCGGERPCACGDRVVEDYRLPADLGPCDGSGLRIAAKIRFDGGGHSIRGSGYGGVGLQVGDEGSGSHISALTVSGFHHGIRLRGARGVTLSQFEASGNGDPLARTGYGIDFAAAASDNVLERVRVHGNADEGIHIGAGAARNRISDSEVFANGRENVYFLPAATTASSARGFAIRAVERLRSTSSSRAERCSRTTRSRTASSTSEAASATPF